MFNKDRFYLGKLCKNNHEHENSGKSLRYKSKGHRCFICKKNAARRNYIKHQDKIKDRVDNYQKLNAEKVAILQHKRYLKSSKRIKENVKKYAKENKEKILKAKRKYEKNKRKTDINYKLIRNLRTRINALIMAKNIKKSKHSLELLGCSIEFYKQYLESKFYNNMTWDNIGKAEDHWQIHHTIPLHTFDMSIPENQLLAFNYTNTEPYGLRIILKNIDLFDKFLN